MTLSHVRIERDLPASMVGGMRDRMVKLTRMLLPGRWRSLESLDPRALGRVGEDIAVRMLTRSGLHVLARNRRIAGVEIDVIAESPPEGLLLVMEVKTSRGGRPPESRVDLARRRRLVRAASILAADRAVAIEVVAIAIEGSRPVLQRFRLEGSDIEC